MTAPSHERARQLALLCATAYEPMKRSELLAYIAQAERNEHELAALKAFLREHGPDLMLYTKPQVEGLKRPCRDALGEVLKRVVKP